MPFDEKHLPIIDYELLQYNPSVIATACVMAARNIAKVPPWSKHLEYAASIEFEQVKECYELLQKLNSQPTTPRVDVVPNVPHEKVLELNQNIFNQVPAVQPTTTKAGMEGSCMIRTFAKPVLKEEKFNIKAKREQIENIKKTIKDKLISLNNKSKSIETLLEEDVPLGIRNTAFKSYRGAYTKTASATAAHDPTEKPADVSVGLAPSSRDTNKSELLPLGDRQIMGHKPNCSTVDVVPLTGNAVTVNNLKEKENNKHVIKPAHGEQLQQQQQRCIRPVVSSHVVRDSVGTSDVLSVLLQKTMRI